MDIYFAIQFSNFYDFLLRLETMASGLGFSFLWNKFGSQLHKFNFKKRGPTMHRLNGTEPYRFFFFFLSPCRQFPLPLWRENKRALIVFLVVFFRGCFFSCFSPAVRPLTPLPPCGCRYIEISRQPFCSLECDREATPCLSAESAPAARSLALCALLFFFPSSTVSCSVAPCLAALEFIPLGSFLPSSLNRR